MTGRSDLRCLAGVLTVLVMSSATGGAQSAGTGSAKARGQMIQPGSSVEQAAEIGVKAHTNFRYLAVGQAASGGSQSGGLPPFAGYLYETPASLACVYHLVKSTPGCNPNLTTIPVSGGGNAIAIVDAFDDPKAAADLAFFSAQFGLPAPTATSFQVVYAGGAVPALDPTGGWEIEESLDIEWAHAMAPGAKLFLVEAKTNSYVNLLAAVDVASALVAGAGGGEVSMSWGGSEFLGETLYDSTFKTPGVVYFASTGDSPGTIWPSVSADVVAAGGTTVSRDLVTGKLIFENAWQEAGGGISIYEARPGFQNSLAAIVGSARGVPDLAFDSNPTTGVWVYDSNTFPQLPAGWYTVGGTSVASPSLAGIVNLAGNFSESSHAENRLIYRSARHGVGFKDIIYGNCGIYASDFSVPGWDFCTGNGSVDGLIGK